MRSPRLGETIGGGSWVPGFGARNNLTRTLARLPHVDVEAFLRNRTDRLRGLDFLGVDAGVALEAFDFLEAVGPEHYGFDPEVVYHSAPSGGRDLVNVFRGLKISPSARLLDIGCGRVSAIRAILKFPFERVDGLEVIPELASIAQKNFRLLNERRTSIHVADATTFHGYGQYSHFYMFNPFPAEVMEQCLERILTARDAAGTPTTLIYVNPLCDSTIMETRRFRRTDLGRQVRGKQALIYRSR